MTGARVEVRGWGVVSPLGDSPVSMQAALVAGAVARSPAPGFFRPSPLATVASVDDFDAGRYLGEGNLRPLDRAGRLATAGVGLALDSARPPSQGHEAATGLVVGTVFGDVGTIGAFDRRGVEAGPLYVKPFDFANAVINAAGGQAAIWHQLGGVNATVSAGTASGLEALAFAMEQLRTGRATRIVAGGVGGWAYEACLGFSRGGWAAAGPTAGAPFARHRSGFVLGEGAAFLVLELAGPESGSGSDETAMGLLLGHGSAFDPTRGDDPTSAAAAYARAVTAALDDAGVDAADIQVVSAGASGSRADAAEALGLDQVFRGRLETLPLTAVRGALGEGLGAGGALQAVSLLATLHNRELPGIAGWADPDPDLPPLAGAAGPRRLDARLGLLSTASFDGHHGAIVAQGAPTP